MLKIYVRFTLMFLGILLVPNAHSVAVEKRPQGILYMAAEPGCYSVTYISSKTVPTKPPKRIYRVSCFEKHHFEVFWSGRVSKSLGDPIPSPKRSLDYCLEQSKKFAAYSRGSNAYNFGPNETIGTGNWLSDKGPEAKRFPNQLVCYFALSNSDFRMFKEINQPLVKGLV